MSDHVGTDFLWVGLGSTTPSAGSVSREAPLAVLRELDLTPALRHSQIRWLPAISCSASSTSMISNTCVAPGEHLQHALVSILRGRRTG
jgi:hypothetical protein